MELREHFRNALSVVLLGAVLALSCMCVMRTLRVVLMDVVFLSPAELAQDAQFCLRSSFLVVRIFFLIILLVSFLCVCLHLVLCSVSV